MSPEVAALLEELAADTQKASVTFFPLGMHTHLMSDGHGGWNLEVHSTIQFPWEEEVTISSEQSLTTEELVGRMSILAMLSDLQIETQASALSADLDAELEAFFNENAGE